MKHAYSAGVLLAILLQVTLGCSRSDLVAEFQHAIKLFSADGKATNVTFDVSKTDSLVSPYIGTVKYIYPSERKDVPDEQMTATFAYQGKKWVLKKICMELDYHSLDAELPVMHFCDDDKQVYAGLTEHRDHWERILAR